MSTNIQKSVMNYEIQQFIDNLPDDIIEINLSYKRFTILPDLSRFKNLKKLDCSYNTELVSLPNLPSTIEFLSFHFCNNLTTIPKLPHELTTLNCQHCKISELPELPEHLLILRCGGNQKHTLPALPPKLTLLSCTENYLFELPELPAKLQILQCNNNRLSSLPPLPDTLTELFCNNNILTHIPNLPDHLKTFICYINKLTSLPPIPDNVQILHCSDNLLTRLPTLPNNIKCLLFTDNPIYERIGSLSERDQNSTDTSLWLFTSDPSKIKIIMRFIEFYYLSKYKKQFKKWLLRTKEKEIMDKYSPENLCRLLEETQEEDYQDVLDVW